MKVPFTDQLTDDNPTVDEIMAPWIKINTLLENRVIDQSNFQEITISGSDYNASSFIREIVDAPSNSKLFEGRMNDNTLSSTYENFFEKFEELSEIINDSYQYEYREVGLHYPQSEVVAKQMKYTPAKTQPWWRKGIAGALTGMATAATGTLSAFYDIARGESLGTAQKDVYEFLRGEESRSTGGLEIGSSVAKVQVGKPLGWEYMDHSFSGEIVLVKDTVTLEEACFDLFVADEGEDTITFKMIVRGSEMWSLNGQYASGDVTSLNEISMINGTVSVKLRRKV